MKSIQYSIIIIICFAFSIKVKGQVKQGFEINAHIDGLTDGIIAQLYRFSDQNFSTGGLIYLDSCVVVNGRFHLQMDDPIKRGPESFYLWFFAGENGRKAKSKGTDSLAFPFLDVHEDQDLAGLKNWFYLGNGDKVNITGKYINHQYKEYRVTGSKSQDAARWAMDLAEYINSHEKKAYHRIKKISDSIGYNRQLIGEQVRFINDADKYADSVLKKATPDQEVAIPILIDQLHSSFSGYHGYFQKEVYSRLPLSVQNGKFGKDVKNIAQLSNGEPFPNFSLQTPEGNNIKLTDFVKKSNITLVHFWATNSIEADKYQRELMLFYKKFHLKGLNILAVSADTLLGDWKEEVELRNFPWTNVIAEPKGWKEGSLINDIYGEGGHNIPNTTNVLLDDKGVILAWDVNGPLLQYYLEKYLGN